MIKMCLINIIPTPFESNVLTIDSNGIKSTFNKDRLLFIARYGINQKGIDLLFDGILIEKYDVKKMARSILDLRDNDEKRKLLEELSKSRTNDFSMDNISMQWMKVIKKIYI